MSLISLDIEKAYDCTWKHRIISKLSTILCHGNLLNYIKQFLQTRSFQVKLNKTTSETFSQENGIPQTSSLSPTLFLIAINDITKCIAEPIKYTLIADDLNIFYRSKQTDTIQILLQGSINNLSKWSSETGFNFSPSKSQSICFTKKKKAKTSHFQNKLTNDSKQRHNENSWHYIRQKNIMDTSSKNHQKRNIPKNKHHKNVSTHYMGFQKQTTNSIT